MFQAHPWLPSPPGLSSLTSLRWPSAPRPSSWPLQMVHSSNTLSFMVTSWAPLSVVFVVQLLFAKLCLTLCIPMDCSTLGFPVLHQLLEFAQTHVHCVNDAIQTSHSLSSPSPPAFYLSRIQGLFQWVSFSHQVAKILELSFSISPSSEYSWLISFRIDWFDLLAVQTVSHCQITYPIFISHHVAPCSLPVPQWAVTLKGELPGHTHPL